MLTRHGQAVGRALAVLMVAVLLTPIVQLGTGVRPASAETDTTARFLQELLRAQRTTRGKGVMVAILSTGVGRIGPLKGVVKHEHDLIKTGRPARLDGTIAAAALAGRGATPDGRFIVRGAVPAADVMSVRIRPDIVEPKALRFYDREDLAEIVAKGIRYATDHGAEVIMVDHYISTGDTDDVAGAVAYANSKRVVVVAGNRTYGASGGYHGANTYPAAVPGVIGVTDVNGQGRPSGAWSGKDSAILVAAPGIKDSVVRQDKLFGDMWGPLAAASMVTAVAVMIRAEYPDLPPRRVAEAIVSSAHHPKGGYDSDVGFGIVDPAGALREAGRLQESEPPVMTARTGNVKAAAHFGGAAPGRVRAVQQDTTRLAGFGGLAAAGLIALVLAGVLVVRSRPRPAVAGSATAGQDSAGPDSAVPPVPPLPAAPIGPVEAEEGPGAPSR